MSHHLSARSVTDDRDLSRAANERYLMLQALSERPDPSPDSSPRRLAAFVHAVRAFWRRSRRTRVTAEKATAATLGLELCADTVTLVDVVHVSPARLDWLVALAEDDTVFSSRFGIAVEPGWAGFPEALPAAVAAARRRSEDPWGTHLFFDDDGALVGIGGFTGPPTNDVVEIGYAVAPSRQGRGIATTAVEHFLAQAAREGVAIVIAHTLAGLNPSTRVLTKTGFVRTTTQHDPEVGEVWRWERSIG
jgi:ribosomal-protein-alanine N-acetyltransferase